jgi:hypothetical protein
VWRITYDELPQPEQFVSRVELMEIDFDFRIERSAHRLQFVEQRPAGVVSPD